MRDMSAQGKNGQSSGELYYVEAVSVIWPCKIPPKSVDPSLLRISESSKVTRSSIRVGKTRSITKVIYIH